MERASVLARSGLPRLQAAALISLAVFSLSTSVPNYLYIVFPLYGQFGFYADENWRVQWINPAAHITSLKVGDVIDWRALPFTRRYDTNNDLQRWSRPGTKILFPVIRNEVRLSVPLVSQARQAPYLQNTARNLWLFGVKKSAELLIILIGAALVFIHPSRPSWLFFLYTAALAADPPVFWSFLPAGLYVAFASIAQVLAFAVPPFALTMFALHLPGEKPSGWRATLQQAAPYLLAVAALLCVAATEREAFAIFGGAWLVSGSEWATLLAWAMSVGVLVALIVGAQRGRKSPLSWACAALAVSALCYLYIDVASRFNLPSWPFLRNFLATVSLLLSLAATYVILRGRVLDVRFIVSRAALFTGIGYCVTVGFALLNLVFATKIAHMAYIIPIEIAIAILLGFRLSGLQDVAAAVDLVERRAPAAQVVGDRTTERDMLIRALARAERTRNPTLIATVRAHAAFGSWFAGEDQDFESQARALVDTVNGKPMRGLRRFARCSRGLITDNTLERSESSEWAARAHLVACGLAEDAFEARRQAALAIESADASNMPFLQVLARVALAEFSAADRACLYDSAVASCRQAGLVELERAVTDLSDGKKQLGMLEVFVLKRLRIRRPSLPTLDICFSDLTVRVFGRQIELRGRELAMLLMISREPGGMEIERIVDQLWPDLDGDAARSALRQTLYRLRKAIGDNAAVIRDGPRYRVRDGAFVDLWELKAMVYSNGGTLTDDERGRLGVAFGALLAGRASRPTQQEWFLPIDRELVGLKRDAGRRLADDALERGDAPAARAIAKEMIEDDPFDEMPRRCAIRAYLIAGDRDSAVYEYRRYRELLSEASLNPADDLAALIAEARSTS